ncbi:MAG: hypothetical protein HY815_26605 [Candidatus Riflebacteria bacterium]|nr:hypothetical protein [Candidatus Riflebacteria bacterium]
MKTSPLVLVLFVCSGAVRAAPPPASPDPGAPSLFKLVYELTPGGPGPAGGVAPTRLEIQLRGGKARLELVSPRGGRSTKVVRDPWPREELAALWKKVQESSLFTFKPRPGAPAPDFGSVSLSAEAVAGKTARSTRLAWTSPLGNDGMIWPLLDHLDRLMMDIDRPAPQAPGSSPASPAPVGEIEMLIATEATRLPLSADETAEALHKLLSTGPLFERQKPKLLTAIDVLAARLVATPRDADLHSLRGAFYHDLREYGRATEEFTRAVELQPGQADHWNNRGVCFLRMGRKEDAVRDLEQASKKDGRRYAHLQPLIQKLRKR